MTPLVSILIPAYNASHWIAETIASALAQTWPRTEIIVVDDGSTDDTLAVAQRLASDRVCVVSQRNQGAATARNTAFARCQGDYIQWLDADDLLSADKIERQMHALEMGGSERTLLSCGWGKFMYRVQHAQFIPTQLWCDLTPAEWLMRKLLHNVHMQTATWLVSRKLTEAAGLWDARLLVDDDGEYFCRVLLASNGVRFVAASKVFYRASGTSGLSYIGRSGRKMESQLHSMRLHIGYLLSLEDSARTRRACVMYLQNWLMHFYSERPDLVKEAEQLAANLGGALETPQLSWKYDYIRQLFGWRSAQMAQLRLRQLRWLLLREWDRLLFSLGRLRASS
jgi:glycosyltransferase involved in cell wall biosynthesis